MAHSGRWRLESARLKWVMSSPPRLCSSASRPFAPTGADWGAAVARWRGLSPDETASYDRSVHLEAASLSPMITFGTNPSMAIPIDGRVLDPSDAGSRAERTDLDKALR